MTASALIAPPGRFDGFQPFVSPLQLNGENGCKRTITASGAEPLQRRAETRAGLLGLRAALALLLDDLFRRLRHESGVAELGVDLGYLVRQLLDLFLQPRALGLEVDHLADWQGISRLADHDLQ